MITKSRNNHTVVLSKRKALNGAVVNQTTTVPGDSISYEAGPKYIDHRLNWKVCFAESKGKYETSLGAFNTRVALKGQFAGDAMLAQLFYLPLRSREIRAVENGQFIPGPSERELQDKFREQIDLNCHDSVMLYSNIIQSVPLLGSISKLNSILSKVSRWWKKSKRTPFTTVVQSAISADFIDRFVIEPTIDDARKFATATDYVIDTLKLMNERNNAQYVPIHTEASNSETLREYGNVGQATDLLSMIKAEPGPGRLYTKSTLGLHTLCELRYDTSSVSAVKLAFARMGITRPLGSLWDLIPFSFVLDYFLKTGDAVAFLDDKISDQAGLMGKVGNIYGQWLTSKSQVTLTSQPAVTIVPTSDPSSWAEASGQSSNYFSYSKTSFSRTPTGGTIYASDGSWGGGLLDVHLSSTRKRTLAQLVIQRTLR
uniref:Maturation n=1 Tax=Leviviridae sp. TaxID=2027243 RepID=A0A142D851_9VIRU|nr:maturation [Leviviridae sp.]